MSDVTLSRSDLFLVLFAAIALAHMVSVIARASISAFLMHRARAKIASTVASGAEMMDKLSRAGDDARARVNLYDRDMIEEVRVIQEGAFLSGWRAAEQCRSISETAEDHVMHHFQWRDAAGVRGQCERAGSGACNKLHPHTGDICARPTGHDGAHSHGTLHWYDRPTPDTAEVP
jgi:hypothetical protein